MSILKSYLKESINSFLKFKGIRLIEKSMSQVSDKAIKAYVNDMLADPTKNISWVPDSIESKVHETLSRALLESLAKVCDNVSIDIMGHKIGLIIKPKLTSPEVQPAVLKKAFDRTDSNESV